MQKKFDNYQDTIPFEMNQCCNTEGICSINSTISSLQEVIIIYLKSLAFYISKLKSSGIENDSGKFVVFYALFNIITNADYKQNEFNTIISKLYDEIHFAKQIYIEKCTIDGKEIEKLKTYFKLIRTFTISDAVKKGEKYSIKKTNAYNNIQNEYYEILLTMLKSISIRIIENYRLGKYLPSAYFSIMEILNTMNFINFNEENIKNVIKTSVETYHILTRLFFETQKELYGEIKETEVSFSTTPGKAILVSGFDFKKLEEILKATHGLEIDVYTHGMEMLMSHAHTNFQKYANFKGHYGFGIEASLMDFSTFPGAIIMSKSTIQRVEFFYRGRLFTLDPIAPMGVTPLEERDISPLIKSAINSKGFSNGQQRPSISVGYDEKALKNKIFEVSEKILSGEIKHLFIIGLINHKLINKTYFKDLFEIFPDDCFAFSLCYPINSENIYHLKSFYDYSYALKIFETLESFTSLSKLPLTVYITKYDRHTISNMLYLANKGVKNVFIGNYTSQMINPSLITSIQKLYNVKEISEPKKDLEQSLC